MQYAYQRVFLRALIEVFRAREKCLECTICQVRLQAQFCQNLPYCDAVCLLSSFVGWGETESTWYVGHHLAHCSSPGS
jgi:hypothetical protein